MTIDYANGGIFYISSTITDAISNPFSLYILNLNTASDTYRSFTITLMLEINSNPVYANTLYLSSGSTVGTIAYTPVYLNGTVSVNSSSTTIIQALTIVYNSGIWRIFSAVSNYF
jgi:hypothetical protein